MLSGFLASQVFWAFGLLDFCFSVLPLAAQPERKGRFEKKTGRLSELSEFPTVLKIDLERRKPKGKSRGAIPGFKE